MKKLLALVLALVMTLGLATVGTNAAFNDQEKIDHTDAVEVMNTLKIIEGRQGNQFDPDANVKRSEMAKMVAIALLGDIDPNAFTGTPTNLTDISGHWAEGYIKFCVAQGIVAGRGNGLFDPEANVTTAEAAKMLLVALGYNADVRKYTGRDWTVAVMRDAQQKGLLSELTKAGTNNAMDRDDAAQMIYNTLSATRVIPVETYNDDGTISTKYIAAGVGDAAAEPRTLLNKTFKAYEFKGVLTKVSYDDVKKEYTYNVDITGTDFGSNAVTTAQEDPDNIRNDFGGGNYDFSSKEDYSDLYGMTVKVLYSVNNKNAYEKVIGINSVDSKVVATGIVAHLPKDKSTDATQKEIKIDGKAYKLTNTQGATPVYDFTYGAGALLPNAFTTLDETRNGALDPTGGNAPTPATDDWRKASTIKLIDNTGDGKGDCLIIYPVGIAKVTYASSTQFTLGTVFGTRSATATSLKSHKVADVDVYSGIAKDDYVIVTDEANTATNTFKIEKLDLVKGATVKAINNADNTANIDGNWIHTDFLGTAPTAGDEINYVAYNGFFVFLEGSSFSGADKFVVVVDRATATKSSSVGGQKLEVKLLQADGTKKTVDVTKLNNADITAINEVNIVVGKMYAYKLDGDEYQLFDVDANHIKVKGTPKSATTIVTSFTDLVLNAGSAATTNATNNMVTAGVAGKAGAPATWVTGDGNSRFTGLPSIADDAVIFAYSSAGGGKYTVMTGAQLKQSKNAMVAAMIGTVTNTTSNFEEIRLAYVNTATAVSTKTNYAFALGDAITYKDGNKYYVSIKLWDGEKVQELRTPSESSAPAWATEIEARDIFSYELDSNGYMNSSSKKLNSNSVAVASYAGANIALNSEVFYTVGGNVGKRPAAASVTYTIDSDTTIFYVNSAAKEGVASGAIQVAQKVTIDAVSTTTAYYVGNVKVLTDTVAGANHIAFIVVDTGADMDGVQG